MPGVYSTMTNSCDYVQYETGANDLPRAVRKVTIKGGAGVSQRRTLITPLGVRTEVTAEQLAFLKSDTNFIRHQKAGFVTIVERGKPDVEAVVGDMSQRDGSAPYVPNDYKQGKEPAVGDEIKDPISEITTKPRYVKPLNDFK